MTWRQRAINYIDERFKQLFIKNPNATVDEILDHIEYRSWGTRKRELWPYKAWRDAMRSYRSEAKRAYPERVERKR
jgi:hypothetical protein